MSYLNTGKRFSPTTPVVLNLILLNGAVFLIQNIFDGPFAKITTFMALWPIESGQFKPYQLVTHMFTHGGLAHILFNMFGLWIFGSVLEKLWGGKRFLVFYFACGLAAGVAQLFLSNAPAIGASGAIMGLFGAFAYLFPNTEMFIFPIPFPIKAKWAVAGLALLDLFGGVNPTGSNIAHFAHLGGVVAGLLLAIYWKKTNHRNYR